MKEQFETPDPEYVGDTMKALFDIEQGVESTPPRFQAILSELLSRIIEKRMEYYIPVEEEEEDEAETAPIKQPP